MGRRACGRRAAGSTRAPAAPRGDGRHPAVRSRPGSGFGRPRRRSPARGAGRGSRPGAGRWWSSSTLRGRRAAIRPARPPDPQPVRGREPATTISQRRDHARASAPARACQPRGPASGRVRCWACSGTSCASRAWSRTSGSGHGSGSSRSTAASNRGRPRSPSPPPASPGRPTTRSRNPTTSSGTSRRIRSTRRTRRSSLEFLDHVDVVVSVHGYSRSDLRMAVLVGGANRDLAHRLGAGAARRAARLRDRRRPRGDPGEPARRRIPTIS